MTLSRSNCPATRRSAWIVACDGRDGETGVYLLNLLMRGATSFCGGRCAHAPGDIYISLLFWIYPFTPSHTRHKQGNTRVSAVTACRKRDRQPRRATNQDA